MPPRQGGRDKNVVTDELHYELRCIQARMEAMETMQKRETDVGDVSESKYIGSDEEKEGAPGGETIEEQIVIMVIKFGSRPKMEVPMYEGNLNVDELLEWIHSMDKYFDCEEVEEDEKVKHAMTRLKGHVALCWDELQANRRRKGKSKIKNWDRMVAKFKGKFMPKDYQLNLFR
jgi:hypothetical protein